LVLLVCLLAQAAVFTAPLWHHHDNDSDDECAVCAAVNISQRVDIPTPPASVLIGQDTLVGILVLNAQADSSALVVRSSFARGPPTSL
jgi:hypothetical protein